MSTHVQVYPDDLPEFRDGALVFPDDGLWIRPPGQPTHAAQWLREFAARAIAEAERLEEYHAQALRDLEDMRAELAEIRANRTTQPPTPHAATTPGAENEASDE